MTANRRLRFPEGFAWGTATSAYQIEGGVREGGRGPSIWDTFARRPGAILDGTTAQVSVDHFHRFREDFALMREIGLRHYRFSIAWPRIFPEGQGKPNSAGLDFYSRLVDSMREHGIEPYATLYHWDLPQALQEQGGWTNRETALRFAEYSREVVRALGDRVHFWMTHNEPWVAAFVGNLYGSHAPGLKDLRTALAAAHTILLSHGLAVPAIRSAGGRAAKVGIVHNLEWLEPASSRPEDVAATARHDGAFNRWFLDATFKGSYPADMLEWYGGAVPAIQPGDMEAIRAPIDFLAVNYYTRRIIAHDPHGDFLRLRRVIWPFIPRADYEEWEVNPEGLFKVLVRVSAEYGRPAIYITENGTPLEDSLEPDGACHDPRRIEYVKGHAAAIWQAIQDGADVRGYFHWSFMDNFEWNLGLSKRFGLVHVDFTSQARTPKDSARWYGAVARENGFAV